MTEKSKWQQYKEKNGTTPLDLLNPHVKIATDDIKNNRMQICYSCPELIKLTTQCKQCGCLMKLKTKLEESKCPIGKW
jgi:hypothetical protein